MNETVELMMCGEPHSLGCSYHKIRRGLGMVEVKTFVPSVAIGGYIRSSFCVMHVQGRKCVRLVKERQ